MPTKDPDATTSVRRWETIWTVSLVTSFHRYRHPFAGHGPATFLSQRRRPRRTTVPPATICRPSLYSQTWATTTTNARLQTLRTTVSSTRPFPRKVGFRSIRTFCPWLHCLSPMNIWNLQGMKSFDSRRAPWRSDRLLPSYRSSGAKRQACKVHCVLPSHPREERRQGRPFWFVRDL